MNGDKEKRGGLMRLVASMLIFGTIGLFRRGTDVPSGLLAMLRGIIGTLFLMLFSRLSGRRADLPLLRRKGWLLFLSGAMIGLNWILLFEAYRFTSVAVATLCYYMQPIIVMLLAPLFLKEKLTTRKVLCVFVALGGMAAVSGIRRGTDLGSGEVRGILLGLGAAAFYAGAVMLNSGLRELNAYDKSICQLGAAALVLLPYVLASGQLKSVHPDAHAVVMVLIMGILHTGVAYALFFGSMRFLRAQTVALVSYVDPITAVLLSALFLKEPMTPAQIVGAVLVLGAVMLSETQDA